MMLIGFQNIISLNVSNTTQKNENVNILQYCICLARSPKKNPSQRKSRKAASDASEASGTGAASSELDD